MEFKTIVYIIVGVLWLLSRFFQKDKQGQESVGPRKTPTPSSQDFPETVRRTVSKPFAQRRPVVDKRRPVSLEEQYLNAPAVSLESPLSSVITPPALQEISGTPGNEESTSSASLARQIADEIKNGQIDWRRSVIISELINRKITF